MYFSLLIFGNVVHHYWTIGLHILPQKIALGWQRFLQSQPVKKRNLTIIYRQLRIFSSENFWSRWLPKSYFQIYAIIWGMKVESSSGEQVIYAGGGVYIM